MGGTKPAFSNCTLVSREDVERYYEKYSEKGGSETVEGSHLSSSVNLSKMGEDDVVEHLQSVEINSNINIPTSCSSELISEQSKPDHTSQDLVSDDKHMDINKVVECQNIFMGKKPKNINEQRKAVKVDKKPKDEANLVKGRVGKKFTSKSVFQDAKCLNLTTIQVDKNVQKLSPVRIIDSIFDQNMQETGKKRKRRSQIELLQSYQFCTDIAEDENAMHGQTCALDANSEQLKADAISLDMNSNIVDDQTESRFDYDNFDEPYSEDHNNDSNCNEPRSPTLLLKRSHNKWHVANAVLPQSGLNDAESKEISDDVMKGDSNSGGLKTAMTKLKDKLKPTKKRRLSHAISKEESSKKKKIVDTDFRPLTAVRKIGKNSVKKANESNKKGKKRTSTCSLNEHEQTNLTGNFYPDKVILDMKAGTSNNTHVNEQHKNFDERKGLPVQDGTDNIDKTSDESREKRENEDSKVKKKRRQRGEMNTFRLIETIPYSALLVVKDGDLCPSHTMAYNQRNCLPGCCHALWRWRLGKPLSMPSQSPVKTTDATIPPVKTKLNDPPLNKIFEDEQSLFQTKFGNLSPVRRLQDEPLKSNQDGSSTIETETKPGDLLSSVKLLQNQQFSCEIKDDESVERKQDHCSVDDHEKPEDPPLVETKQTDLPAEDAKEKEERLELSENKVTEESITTDA